MKPLAIVLVVLGLVGLIYGGVSWTRKSTVRCERRTDPRSPLTRRRASPLPRLREELMLAGGVALLLKGGTA